MSYLDCPQEILSQQPHTRFFGSTDLLLAVRLKRALSNTVAGSTGSCILIWSVPQRPAGEWGERAPQASMAISSWKCGGRHCWNEDSGI